MPPRHCGVIAGQVAKKLDDANEQGREVQYNYRVGQPKGDQGYWRTREGFFMNELGGTVPPLNMKERISLTGKVNGMGEAGAELATKGERFQNLAELHHRSDMTGIDKFTKGLTEDEWKNVISVIEGRPLTLNKHGMYVYELGDLPQQPMNARTAVAAEALKNYFAARRDIAQNELTAGFGAKQGNFYFPIMHDTEVIKTRGFSDRAAQGMAEKIRNNSSKPPGLTQSEWEAQSLGQARMVYDRYLKSQQAKIAHNIEHDRRFDMGEGRVLDGNKVMNIYTKQFWHEVEAKRVFGEKPGIGHFPESAARLLGQIQEEFSADHVNVKYAQAYINDLFGVHAFDPMMHGKFMSTLGGLQALKMSMSAVRNVITGNANTIFRTNSISWLKALDAMAVNREIFPGVTAREFKSMMASIIDEAVVQSTLFNGEGIVARMGEGMLKYTGFTSGEMFNRTMAGLAGVFYAEQQAKGLVTSGSVRYAQRLAELGLDVEKIRAAGGVLESHEQLLAGQKIINATQFRSRMTDLPALASHSPAVWRGLLQFRTYPINQMRLLYDQLQRRPIRTFIYATGLLPGVGYGINFLSELEKGVFPGYEQSKIQQRQGAWGDYLEAIAASSAMGLAGDVTYASYLAGETSGTSFIRLVNPPMMGTLEDAMLAYGQIQRGNLRGLAFNVGRQFGGLGSGFMKSQDWAKQLPKSFEEW
jgi:hypothetical protein